MFTMEFAIITINENVLILDLFFSLNSVVVLKLRDRV